MKIVKPLSNAKSIQKYLRPYFALCSRWFLLGDFLCILTPNTGQMNPLFHTFVEFILTW